MLSFILTFNFQVCFAGEVVALSDNAGVSSGVAHFRIFDDQGEDVVVVDEGELGAFVTLLHTGKGQKNC